jgi:hypothetical protein
MGTFPTGTIGFKRDGKCGCSSVPFPPVRIITLVSFPPRKEDNNDEVVEERGENVPNMMSRKESKENKENKENNIEMKNSYLYIYRPRYEFKNHNKYDEFPML